MASPPLCSQECKWGMAGCESRVWLCGCYQTATWDCTWGCTVNYIANGLRDFEKAIPSLFWLLFPILAVLSLTGCLSHMHKALLSPHFCTSTRIQLSYWVLSLCAIGSYTGNETPCQPHKSSFENEKFLCMWVGRALCLPSRTISM